MGKSKIDNEVKRIFVEKYQKAMRLKCESELREILGVSPQAMAQYRCGDVLPSIEKLVLIADYFDRDISWFFRHGVTTDSTNHD
jgi:transcriptional regulator with XRE-family HTH domain